MFKFSSDYSSKDQMFLCIYIIILHNSLLLAKKKNIPNILLYSAFLCLTKKLEIAFYSINSNFIIAKKRDRRNRETIILVYTKLSPRIRSNFDPRIKSLKSNAFRFTGEKLKPFDPLSVSFKMNIC